MRSFTTISAAALVAVLFGLQITSTAAAPVSCNDSSVSKRVTFLTGLLAIMFVHSTRQSYSLSTSIYSVWFFLRSIYIGAPQIEGKDGKQLSSANFATDFRPHLVAYLADPADPTSSFISSSFTPSDPISTATGEITTVTVTVTASVSTTSVSTASGSTASTITTSAGPTRIPAPPTIPIRTEPFRR
ncbi:hypothetical protein EVG20_g3329 [Dentipellis fragilis]|uniref:Uncharacterized protein n=1 Tax=Dentipellis fragilis TaxID=205917 RepID=A0A4Y9Z589_9AGAM|nr:hypothetical protein EVG20_g3329 [Dentipellis fragilis]